jgi:DNA-directed RNA polymerase specialized sigma24 family protein
VRRGAAPVAPSEAAPESSAEFETFVRGVEPRLRRALVAAYGFEDGRDATAEALAYAWEHWARVRDMPNAAGYLFRIAQSSAARGRRWHRRPPSLLNHLSGSEHEFEPGLPKALASLSERQRIA